VTGLDWISGNAFFIRNRREPTLFWFVHDDNTIRASHQDRTKFRITCYNDQGVNERKVLIRSDQIIIRSLQRPAVGRISAPTTVKSGENGRLELGINETGKQWHFGNFINTFGVQAGDEHDTQGNVTRMSGRYVTVMNKDPNAEQDWGDEWELV
jgi:hypothetical protein